MMWRQILFTAMVTFATASLLADNISPLSVGQVVHAPISRGDIHQYQIDLTDQVTRVAIEPSYFDVAVVIRRLDGTQVLRANSPPMEIGDEVVVFVPEEIGTYIVEVEGISEYHGSGNYTLSTTLPAYNDDQVAAALASTDAAGIELDSPLLDPQEAHAAALSLYSKSAESWAKTNNDQQQSRSLAYAGWLAFELGDLDTAADKFSKALSLGQGSQRQDAWVQAYLGSVELDRDRMTQASDYYKRALDVARQANDDFGTASFLNYLGLVNQYQNLPRAAAEWYTQALEVLKRIDYPHQEATTLSNVGGTQYQMGDFDSALAYYHRALDIVNRINDVDEQATVLGNMASLYRDQGDLAVSLQYNQRTLEIYRLLGDQRGINLVYYRLGILFHRMGDYQRAESYYRRVYEHQEAHYSSRRTANALRNLGALYMETGETQKALFARTHALELYTEINSTVNVARARAALADTYIRIDRFEEALSLLSEALPILESAELMPEVADTLMHFAAYYTGVGDVDSARSKLEDALDIHRSTSDPIGETDSLIALASIEIDAADALNKLHQAEVIVRSVRQEAVNPALKARFAATMQKLYDGIVRSSLALQDDSSGNEFVASAFMASERNRARSLLELVTASDMSPSKAHAETLEQHKKLQRQLNALQVSVERLRSDIENPEIQELVNEKDAAVTDLMTKLDHSANRLTRHFLPGTGSEPVTDAAIRSALDSTDVLLHFHLGELESAVWRVTQNDISVRTLPARADIERLARDAYADLSSSSAYADDRRSIAELAELLLGDPTSFSDYRRVYVVADGALQYIPMVALFYQSGDTEESRKSFINLPSSRFLLREREAIDYDADTPVLVYADPIFSETDFRTQDGEQLYAANELTRAAAALGLERMSRLPFSSMEAEAIRGSARATKIISGFNASKQNVLNQDLNELDILHFATHGIVNDRNPALSGLVFSLIDENEESQDGFLSVGDIASLSMDPRLVVLSACETGIGEALAGEGLLSLSRAFVAQGADDVVASLWQVNDRATAELMRYFYAALFDQQKSVDEALSFAQRQISAQPEWSAPYFWAGFIATSTGRSTK